MPDSGSGWIFSSIIQSTAAFLAIVGGFFTGTVLQLVSKRAVISEEILDARARHVLLSRLRRDAVIKRDRYVAVNAIRDESERIIRNPKKFANPAAAKSLLRLETLDEEAFLLEWTAFADGVRSLRSQISDAMGRHHPISPDFDTWLPNAGLGEIDPASYLAREVYEHERMVWLKANPDKWKRR